MSEICVKYFHPFLDRCRLLEESSNQTKNTVVTTTHFKPHVLEVAGLPRASRTGRMCEKYH